MTRAINIFWALSCMLFSSASSQDAAQVYSLREEQQRGTFVGNVKQDMMLRGELSPGPNNDLRFRITTNSDSRANLFAINETSSTIYTTKQVDREAECPQQRDCLVTLEIAVYRQNASLDLFKLRQVVVRITDLNDNPPTFPASSVSLSVLESASPARVLTRGAVDADTGDNNSVQEYHVTPLSPPAAGLFQLKVVGNLDGSSDLEILINEPLDREARDFYQLLITVVDGGYPQMSGSVTINITVTDANDNKPRFLQQTYNASVEENVRLQTSILQVSAVDDDIGDNARIKYVVSARAPDSVRASLAVDPQTGVIFSQGPIDYEATQQFQFLVEAKNEVAPFWAAEAFVTVNVQDVNDNSPVISINLSPDGTNIAENEPVGKFIAHVSVSDADSGENGRVTCSVDDLKFSLESFLARDTYKVVLSIPLDYETSPSHRVTLTCRDNGVPVLSKSDSFDVRVIDVNDNPPVFSKYTYTSSITENSSGVESLLQVSASDRDTGLGGQVEFLLEDNPRIRRLFYIDQTTGVLQVRSPVDREETGQFTFSVLARDKGTPSLTSTAAVIVTVEDENDERPYFIRPSFDCYIMEKQPAGTRVGNVSARDNDTSQNARMAFSILPDGPDGELFSIEAATGVLRSRATFYREVRHVYRFRVKVEDPEIPAFFDVANVTVQVQDDNDNLPVIEYPREGNNTVAVAYNTPVGSVLAVVRATDTDVGPFGQIVFLISAGDPSGLFDLNRATGVLRLGRSLQPSDVKEHVLEIRVQDGGSPPAYETAVLHVVVAAGNATLAAPRKDADQNILIVVILICVTAIMAIAILTTICLIRRIDRERRQKRALAKAEEEKMFHLKSQDTFSSLSHEPSSGSESSAFGNGTGKNRKKEVSFSIDDGVDSLNISAGSGHTLSTFRSPGGKHGDQERNCLSVLTPGLRGEPGMLNIPINHRMSSDDNHLQTVQEEEGCQLMEMLKRNGEDAMSESSGETGTSDSGRGGSEDDSHSNRGSGLEADASTMYPMPPAYTLRVVAPTLPGLGDLRPIRTRHSGRGASFGSASGRSPRQHAPHVSFSGNLEYLGEASTDRDDDLPPPPPPAEDSPPPPPTPPFAERNFPPFGSSRHPAYRSVLHSHPGNHGYGGVSTSIVRNSGLATPPSGADGGRPRWGSPSFTDDDDRTTTSGSYTINPDDLRKEIDELILKDMIV